MNGKPTNPVIRNFYDQMVKGLQEFRNYLTILQLSYELQNKKYETVIIDTPPFPEAVALYRAVFNLQHFFGKTLAQIALKTASVSWLHSTMKQFFKAMSIFIGKKASAQVFDFIEWLLQFTEKFQHAALYIEKLFAEDTTTHTIVLTPDTRHSFIKKSSEFFKEIGQVEFVINRSTTSFELPEGDDPFLKGLQGSKNKEIKLLNLIQKEFESPAVEKIPLMLMGEDSKKELLNFVKA